MRSTGLHYGEVLWKRLDSLFEEHINGGGQPPIQKKELIERKRFPCAGGSHPSSIKQKEA